jgi:MFS family permease
MTASAAYQIALVVVLSLNFGVVFFDRNAVSFLMPFIQKELHLDNTRIGMIAGALSLTWAISGFVLGRMSDRTGQRKAPIILATILFSLCSVLSGFAGTFAMLLGSRLLMGVAEGAVLPISQSMLVEEIRVKHRGLAAGIMQNLGSNVIGGLIGPVVLIGVATAYGWRRAFWLAGAPGLVCAALMASILRDPKHASSINRQTSSWKGLGAVLATRNVVLCTIIGILLISHFIICWTFMPLFLVQGRAFAPSPMSWLMGLLGLATGIGGVVGAGLSDRFGRKPVMVVGPLLGLLITVAAFYVKAPPWMVAALLFLGGTANGLSALFLAIIPSESVDPRFCATVLGYIMGAGEIFGGVLSPPIAGHFADQFGISAPVWIMAALVVLSSLFSLGLTETAPSRTVLRRA